MQHDNHGDAWKWTDIEHCPLNDFAPEGKALHAIVEEMADDHDVFGNKTEAQKLSRNGHERLQRAALQKACSSKGLLFKRAALQKGYSSKGLLFKSAALQKGCS